MFNKPTLILIGAGASFECRMPLGSELMGAVATRLRFRFDFDRLQSGDDTLLDLLKQRYGSSISEYTRAANELVSILPNFVSLDEALHYLSAEPKCVSLGKLAIVHSILMAERTSVLKYEPQLSRPNVAAAAKTWLQQFLSMAISAARKADVPKIFENITFLNFNYDRTLEHYLYWAMQTSAGVTPQEAANAVSSLQVIRPYGCVGTLDWQNKDGVKFGGPDYFGPSLFTLANQIRTFTEQHQSDIPARIDEAVSNARVVIILGFGFHDQNTRLLRSLSKRGGSGARTVFATMKGIAAENESLLREKLRDAIKTEKITLTAKTANELLVDMRPSILAAAS